jgi:D-alanyl-D-alanine carboxypeptidase (penicillin-binding protein 5/6)
MLRIEVLITVVVLLLQPWQAAAAVSPPPFELKARAAVLMNALSGQILFEQNPEMRIAPASLAKLMTLYIALDAISNRHASLTDDVRISEQSWRTGGSKMFVEVGKTIPLATLLQGIAVVSGNDACAAVAEYIAGSEEAFVDKMNRKAAELGLNNTAFRDSNGLTDENQYTTARDLARLACSYIKDHPEGLKLHSTKEMNYGGITQRNRNGLLWLDGSIDGLKTGYISSAGYHLIATACRDGDRYIAVVLGAGNHTDRENAALKLLNYGFKNFTTQQAVVANMPLAKTSVWKGVSNEVAIGVLQTVFLTTMRDSKHELKIENDCPAKVFAPISLHQALGQARVIVDGSELARLPVVALEAVEKAGFFKRSMQTSVLLFVSPPYWGVWIVLAVLAALICLVAFGRGTGHRKKEGLTDIID